MSKIHLDIETNEATTLLHYYQKQYDSMWLEIPAPLRKRLMDSQAVITAITMQLQAATAGNNSNNGNLINSRPLIKIADNDNNLQYDRDSSRFQNALYAIQKRGCLITTRQIIECWLGDDPKLLEREGISMGEMQGKVSSTLKQKVDNGVSINRVGTTDEYYYGLIEWFDSKGVPKSEYMPTEFSRNNLFTFK